MKVFEIDYRWNDKEFEQYVDRVYDKILDYTRHNPTSTGALAKWCKDSNFPPIFHGAVVIRQIVSYLRRHKGAYIGTTHGGTFWITDVEGWNQTRDFLNKKLRILQSTYSSVLTSEINWYRQRGLRHKHEYQQELKL